MRACRGDRQQLGRLLCATGLGARTARVERAAGRPRRRARRLADEPGRHPGRPRTDTRGRGEQGARVGMARVAEHLVPRSPARRCLPRYITATRSQTWRTAARLCEIISDADAEPVTHLGEEGEDRRLHRDVERGDGLVGNEYRGSTASARAMAIRWRWPAREGRGVAVERVGGQSDERHQLAAARLEPLRRGRGGGPTAARATPTRSEARVERAVRILEDELDRPPLLAACAGRAPPSRTASPSRSRAPAGRRCSGRRVVLPRARLADQAEHLPAPQRRARCRRRRPVGRRGLSGRRRAAAGRRGPPAR